MSEMIERVARAITTVNGIDPDVQASTFSDWPKPNWHCNISHARAAINAMQEPTEAQWDGLARQIIMWMDMEPKTPRALFKHLERSGYEIPQWLRDEPEMKNLDHVPSKGTRAVLVYRAMIDAALRGEEG
jgi:hypothetical protein